MINNRFNVVYRIGALPQLIFTTMKNKKDKNLLGKALVKCWRYFFCQHRWKLHSSNRYNVNRGNGTKEGEVTLTLFECELCGRDKLVPSDRTHEKIPLAFNGCK